PLGTDLNALPPGSSVFVEWNGVTPHTYQWNFALERQLSESIVASATYIGSKSVHQTTSANPNQFIPYKKFDPTVGYDRWYTPAASDPDFLGRANLNFEAYRMTPWGGAASYHGLELNLKQRYARGLQYNISYTWSKNLSNVALGNEGQQGAQGSPQNWYDRDAEKGNSPLHVKHNFIVSSTYDLPIGTGKTFGANWGGLSNAILGGWSINGVLRDRSGLPGTATIGGNRSRSGGVQASGSISERADLKGDGNNNPTEGVIEVGCGSFQAGTKLGTIENWFDPCQFVRPPAGRYGNVGTYTIIGGKLFNMDFSVFKSFPVREGTDLQFRAEFFNVFNHPNFGGGGGQVITAGGNVNSNAGRITSTTTENRRIQFALKLTF
ncbi:MAG: hypothetical protein HY648_02060, partial [Acidobacteria bacterium]|nr:hypothetical protein [Acidobacteriota bacterium]